MLKTKGLLSLMFILALVISTIVVSPTPVYANTIAPYQLPSIYLESTVYSLKVNGVEVPVVSYTSDYDYANLSMSTGTTTVEVTCLPITSISSYSISPKKLNLSGTLNGNKLTFTISKDEYLIVQISNYRRLIIAADPGQVSEPASAGTGIFNVKSSPYNADSTGNNLTTTAIQNAIDAASAYNGGIVYIPTGVYKVSNLQLKSNVNVYLQNGAVLVASTNKSDYTMNWHKDSINKDVTWWISTVTGATNIKIYGRGTIDGNGAALVGFANNLLVPMQCSYFTVDGITFRDSGSWAVTPARSDNLTFTNVKFFNRITGGAENDGIDICECQTATVTNAIGASLDDPFSAKTWDQTADVSKNWPGAPETNNDVTFDDCIAWSCCYGYKVGAGILQNQSNITFKNSVVYDCSVGIGIAGSYGTGTASGITFDNIDIENVRNTNGSWRNWFLAFTANENLHINNVTVKNINVRDKGTNSSILNGFSSTNQITGVTFDNISMPGSSSAATTLYDMNIGNKSYYSGITILPIQNPEPVQRTNLALNKPAYASTGASIASAAFDGNIATRWGSDRGVDPSWIYVDLGTPQVVNGFKIQWEVAYGSSYQIQTSNDAVNWFDAYTTTTGDGGEDNFNFTATLARYIRMYGTVRATQYGYSIWEFEVYGPEASPIYKEDLSDGAAQNWTTSGGTWTVVNGEYSGANATGNATAYYSTTNFSDFTYALTGRFIGSTSGDMNIIFRYQDANNYYQAFLSKASGYQYLRLYKIVNGAATQIGSQAAYNASTDTNLSLSIVANGSYLRAQLGSNLTAVANDSTFATGKIGVKVNKAQVNFDNITVYP
jgi:hypothetical protein